MDRRTKRDMMARLTRDADRICERFALCYHVLEAERANVKSRYGICYSDGTIKIRLRHANTGRPLKYSSLVNTLCHELAHLRHFNHGPRFQHFYLELVAWSRQQGIYRPGQRVVTPPPQCAPAGPTGPHRDPVNQPVPAGPVQLTLF
jgi:predicted metal-dependent hydrolase